MLCGADGAALDAGVLTYYHAYHGHGIYEVRQVYQEIGRPVRGLARADTLASLEQRFAYAFEGRGGYPPTIAGAQLPDSLTVGDLKIAVTDQPHGAIHSAGLRFTADGFRVGYATDFNILTDRKSVV